MKLEEGMYVRTKDGIIAKCEEIIEDLDISFDRAVYDFGNSIDVVEIPWHLKDEYIKKASHNTIDLIEVGDYVNGKYIDEIDINRKLIYSYEREDYYIYEEREVRTIVTKEQFESMCYKL